MYIKRKILFLAFFGLVFFFFVPAAFAKDVTVAGRVENKDIGTGGSKIIFKDSVSQQEVVSKEIDPLGSYVVFVPEGTYDITILPQAESGLKPITKTNQKIVLDTQVNFTLPSSQRPLESFMQGIPQNVLYAAAGGVVLLLLLIIGIAVAKRK
jgi:hypothetical protein